MTPGPDEIKTQEPEPFLERWSRRKETARLQPQEPVPDKVVNPEEPAPPLPPVDELTPESDFRAFFHPKVDENVRRAALKKLFSDPHFNVMDGLDTYIDDYSKTEPIPAAMLAGLKQAQNILQWAREDVAKLDQNQLQPEPPVPGHEASASPPVQGSEVTANAPGSIPAAAGGDDKQART